MQRFNFDDEVKVNIYIDKVLQYNEITVATVYSIVYFYRNIPHAL